MSVRLGPILIVCYLLVQWIFVSSLLILYNKYLLSHGFRHPLTLTLLHMIFGSLASATWKALGLETVPKVSFRDWLSNFLPVGMAFAASLSFGNEAYVYISVAYIQMLKASTPVAVLLLSFLFRLEQPTVRLAVFVVLISSGVTIACMAQIEKSILGTTLQLVAVLCEGVRLCLVNMLLTSSRGLKLSSIANLYYIAPACMLSLLGPWALLEAESVLANSAEALRREGFLVLLSNSCVAFALNLATLALIKRTSALTLNVAGVVKDLLLIGWCAQRSACRGDARATVRCISS